MAISLISPGIKITETDFISSSQTPSRTAGAFVGQFRWGPINEVTQIGSESDLVINFGKPNATNAVDFYSAANFLNYSGNLSVVRVANTALNATAEQTTGSGNTGTGLLISNRTSYDNTASFDVGPWAARYAGELGNSLKVSVCPSSNAWSSSLTGTFTIAAGSTTVVGAGSAANTQLTVGDYFVAGNRAIKVASITNTTHFTLASGHLEGITSSAGTRRWEYFNEFSGAPGTSDDGTLKGASNDEMHIIVVDEDGAITNGIGTVLEKYEGVSKGSDARSPNGGSNYYKNVINQLSSYIYWTDHDAAGSNWGNTLIGTTYTAVTLPKKYSLAGGSDGYGLSSGDRTTGYKTYLSVKETVPVSVIIAGQAVAATINSIITDVCETRKDCIVCFSPLRANVVNNTGNEVTDILTFADTITRSTYAFADSGWKYQYDRYNDTYIYVPLNADVAGCMARNDTNRDPWISPAGISSGNISNVLKLSWNPKQADRDTLYKIGINPVFTQTGRGTVLFGDKTFVLKNQSTNRINVRRLFIELQKTIGAVAETFLFEQNDVTTRTAFVNLVIPYLRSVQARRGVSNFRVVCDTTNNPESVVNNNEFICDIFIQPIGSVNFIQLNFVSVRGSANFTEVAA
ncbi:hypothetical protein EB118_14375 [bacterium]|nr:hypothetical protein [bacterium]